MTIKVTVAQCGWCGGPHVVHTSKPKMCKHCEATCCNNPAKEGTDK